MSERDRLPFVRQAIPIGPGYVGSRWWNEVLAEQARSRGRRHALVALGVMGGAVVVGAVAAAVADSSGDDDVDSTTDALELQKTTSWNIGGTDRALSFPGGTRADVDGARAWEAPLFRGQLDQDLRPTDLRLQPYYVPTLFQAPAAPTAQGLRSVLAPITTPATEEAFLRGQALATVLEVSDSPPGVGVIVDIPGPESVAVAAGLAGHCAPVFTFANWPHPLGVVSAHLTLASALYYVPLFRRMDLVRPQGAPPAFILDANRLAPYRDDAQEFDNRYVASLPSVDSLRSLGIQKLLYVRPDGDSLQELDDLNADFTAYQQAGIDVRAVALTDFRPDGSGATRADAGVAPAAASVVASAPRHTAHYYWGGWLGGRSYFWSSYGWSTRPTPVPAPRPINVSRASAYRPAPRQTMFAVRTMGAPSGLASRGIGKQKPSGFGRISVRTARGTGAITGVRTGRTGSFGRSRFSGSG